MPIPEVYDPSGLLKSASDHGALLGLTDDDHTQYPIITSGSGSPSSTPARSGAVYIDTTSGAIWIATGNSNSNDWRMSSAAGWLPYALPIGLVPTSLGSDTTLAANGGSLATPVFLPANMLLQSVLVRNGDTSGTRTWGWDLYLQYNNSGDSSQNTLSRVANSSADESFTASAISDRIINAASAPVALGPGLYWLVIQNRHASNTFIVKSHNVTPASWNPSQTKTTSNPNGSTLDFVAATWTKINFIPGALLQGRVFGESSAF